MVIITFENDIGKITMGGADYAGIRMYSVTGIGLNPAERTVKVYNGYYGGRCENRRVPERTVTISGEINSDYCNRIAVKQRMCDVFSEPGVMTISNGARRRAIKAEAVQLDFGDRNQLLQKFTVQYACEEGVFYSPEPRIQRIFHTEKLVRGTYSLPMVLSRRHTSVDINNTGHYPIFPIIRIYDAGARAADDTDGGIIISNLSTGASLNIVCQTSEGEVMTVDIPERRVLSSITDGDMYCFSDDTVPADFVLQRGNNIISTENHTARNVVCEIEYNELFAECEVV